LDNPPWLLFSAIQADLLRLLLLLLSLFASQRVATKFCLIKIMKRRPRTGAGRLPTFLLCAMERVWSAPLGSDQSNDLSRDIVVDLSVFFGCFSLL